LKGKKKEKRTRRKRAHIAKSPNGSLQRAHEPKSTRWLTSYADTLCEYSRDRSRRYLL